MTPEISKWMEYAKRDLAVARHLLHAFQPSPLEIVCYHCQQAAEKAIKAVYLSLDIPGGLPRKHDLSFLLEQMRTRVTITDALLDHADRLTIYGVLVRYPSDIELDPAQAARAVRYADEIMHWAENALSAQ